MGDRSEKVGERGQMFPDLRRIVGLCNENPGIFGPLSHLRSRFIHNPTASYEAVGLWGIVTRGEQEPKAQWTLAVLRKPRKGPEREREVNFLLSACLRRTKSRENWTDLPLSQ